MKRPASDHHRIPAVLGTLLVHGAIALLLVYAGRKTPPRRHFERVEVDFVAPPRAVAAAPPEKVAPPAPAPEVKPAPKVRRVAQGEKRAAPVEAAPTENSSATPPVSSSPPESVSPPPSDLPRAPRLGLSGPSTSGFAVPERTPDAGTPGEELAAEDARHVKKMLDESQARGRVDRGLVDPYFVDLGKQLLKSWDAEKHVKRSGLKGLGEQFVENSRTWSKIWVDRATQYGSSGSPMGNDPMPAIIDRTGDTTGLAAKAAYQKLVREQFKATKRATLRVVQGKDGKLKSVTLVSPSNDPGLDKEALADVRAAAETLPPPPGEGLGIKDPITSLWEFELIISITPPIPSINFEFDEALGFLDARLPLDRRIYKHVRLVGVE